MLYNLFTPLSSDFPILNLFWYLTFRTGGAIITALVISFLLGPYTINLLKKKQKRGQPIRKDGPETHLLTKRGTPTMGGVLILTALVVSTLLWANLTNPYVWIVVGTTLGFGAIGFIDDYIKLTKRDTKGFKGSVKIVIEFAIAALAITLIALYTDTTSPQFLAIPFFKSVIVDLGYFFVPFMCCVIVGTANAVNLTDGLDGLAIVPIMIAAGCFLLIAYLAGNAIFANYLQIHYIPGAGEIAVFCGALVGASLGFLWFNAPPAMVFMGDTGSLAVGGGLGAIAVVTKHEIVLMIIGGLFVLETVSVIVQVVSFKLTGKRVFRMAPIHHHFEKLGWAEPTVVIRFWIIATILALIGLSTLKLR